MAMRIYLAQHGSAVEESVDPARPLSEEGRGEALKVAWALNRAAVKPAAICHSGKLRAAQTAELFAAELGVDDLTERKDLKPKADPAVLAAGFDDACDGVLFVGHLPHLQRLVVFRNAGVVCLERGGPGWSLAWYLTPEVC